MSKAQADMKENINGMLDTVKTLALAGAASFTALAVAGVSAASSLNETQNIINTTFGKNSAQIDAWAQNASAAYGMNESSALKYVGTMGAMFNGMGVTSAQAQQMSESITGLAGDMASFYNMSTDDAFSKLQAEIAGQTKPLRDLGINMSTANLQAYANVSAACEKLGKLKDTVYTPDVKSAEIYNQLFAEYRFLYDYFGQNGNNVMKRLKKLRKMAFIEQ